MALHKMVSQRTVTDSMEETPVRHSALKGALIIGGGSVALVVGAFFAITALTAPDGWLTRMSHASLTVSGEDVGMPD